MSKAIYTAEAHVTGGRADGHGKTSDGNLEVDLRLPTEMGGKGDGTNPEELFAVGYAGCLGGAGVATAPKVPLPPGPEGPFTLSVVLDVTLPSVEGDAAVNLVREAHKVCPYSNATRGNIDVTLTANGAAVSGGG